MPLWSMEKFFQSIIINLVKWTPSGVGIGVTAHELLADGGDTNKAVLAAFLTGCSTLWVRFSGNFMEEAGNEAAARGGGLAKWMFAVGDRAVQGLQESTAKVWRNLASDFEDKYYQRLIFRCRNYETQGLDKDRVLKLQHMFVPLKISQKSLAKISPDLIQELSGKLSGQQEIGDLLVWMSKDSIFRRLAILGVPGSGKTTLMRYLTFIYASRQQRKVIHPKAPTYIPVLMYLRDVRQDIVSNPKLPLVDLINTWVQQLQTIEPLKPPSGWFAGKLKQNRCLILLDGLDEISDETERRTVSQWVDFQMQEYPDAPFILTSRPLGYQYAKLHQPVTVLEVQPFTLRQVQQFIHTWYLETETKSQNNDDLGVRDEAQSQANDLIKRVRDSSPLVAMAVNPLLLTMITTVHRRGSALPGKRVELYKEICQVLLEKRQRAKGLAGKLTASQKQAVLQGLALDLMSRKTRSFIFSDVEDFLRQRLQLVLKDAIHPEQFLKQTREVSGLLVAKEEGTYEFVHLSFQEYLASVETRESNQEQLLIDAFHKPERLSWWSETIRLYAAQGDSSSIIQAAIQCSTVESLALAFDCLQEGKSVDPLVRARLETILEEGLEAR